MKAKCIAAVLSLSVIHFSAYSNVLENAEPKNQIPLVTHKIDINTADSKTLTGSIKGIGKKRAEAIIAYRTSHHGFKSLEELAEVKGLGQHFVDTNRDQLNTVFVLNKTD